MSGAIASCYDDDDDDEMVLTLHFNIFILTFWSLHFFCVFVLYCLLANPASGCRIPINDDDDDVCSSIGGEIAVSECTEQLIGVHYVDSTSTSPWSSHRLIALLMSLISTTDPTCHYDTCWSRGTVVQRRSLAGELSLSCARPEADR